MIQCVYLKHQLEPLLLIQRKTCLNQPKVCIHEPMLKFQKNYGRHRAINQALKRMKLCKCIHNSMRLTLISFYVEQRRLVRRQSKPLTKLYHLQDDHGPRWQGDEDKLCHFHLNQIHFQSVEITSLQWYCTIIKFKKCIFFFKKTSKI